MVLFDCGRFSDYSPRYERSGHMPHEWDIPELVELLLDTVSTFPPPHSF